MYEILLELPSTDQALLIMGARQPGMSALTSTLSITGLALAGLSTYAVVCYANAPETNALEAPVRVFSWGGVLGMNRGAIVVTWNTLLAALTGVAALGVCDLIYARHTKARYFALHVICNVWIAALCIPDCIFLFTDPLSALRESAVNHWPTALVFSIHVYHMCFFENEMRLENELRLGDRPVTRLIRSRVSSRAGTRRMASLIGLRCCLSTGRSFVDDMVASTFSI